MFGKMTGCPSARGRLLGVLVCLFAGASGCTIQERAVGNYNTAEYQIGSSRVQQGLRFAPDSAALEAGEKLRLDGVLRSLALRPNDDIVLYLPASGSEVLDERRVEQARVAAEGHVARVRVVPNSAIADQQRFPDTAIVHVFRYNRLNVICPNQGVDFADDRNGYREILMGCTNAANLAEMAHDRSDLTSPDALGGSATGSDVKAVEAYHDWAERTTKIVVPGGGD